MRPGELRKFKDDPELNWCRGCTFLVLSTYHFEGAERLDMLMLGERREHWLYSWVEMKSEVISEAG